MSNDIFIKIDGIEGESKDAKHKNEIDISSWRWGMDQRADMHSGSGGGAGKASVTDLRFHHAIDRASPNLMKYCLTGKHIDQAVLVMRKAGGNALEHLKITMSDVIVSSVTIDGASDSEAVTLSFAKVKQEYMVQNEQGGSGGAVTASFDIKANKEA
ncbi:Hcp family type VI secretion system effector [Burkholderia ubonensis]|uniref:Hcp family type VI secretion system effector n=1 Tax=Burkholderia ubonensis TaxID=101571 RepID=UPI000BA74F94|nr:type VI secretion system tube protein Hcp [Burkholderia ubonensis]PAK16012.1 Hcp1 family type VI secretion system effector [Burkholderia ubonensis]RQP38902.1 Hcp1 family type VI secretion system effector [Burkholderia ubonensis]RQP39207.1 Hcp1 family type VI secretion system effector [Burkholderia ubonensis]RQP44699.1 Hcp1 family type VI secretion system effector [Burkholderia ubonensis]RQP58321.1 Hcp1 family type VI secretion system effector [Burkholderia ubonensis]